MIDTSAFTKMVPGFDFLQSLMQGAGQATPAMGQWIAPTLNPEELEKRIGELKTVQFWLEQNSRMIGVTIQALEVQRMTLSTLQTMNLPLADLRNALTLPTAAAAAKTPAPAQAPAPSKPAIAPLPAAVEAAAAQPAADAGAPPKAGAVDPMLWWGALTQQFTELATKAMQDSRAVATHTLAAAKAAGHASAPDKPAARSKAVAAKAASAKPARKRG